MLKLAYKVGSRGGAMVSTSARKAGDPWFESRSWYDRFLFVNIYLFILMHVSCNTSNLLKFIYMVGLNHQQCKTIFTERFRLAPSSEFTSKKKFNISTGKSQFSIYIYI